MVGLRLEHITHAFHGKVAVDDVSLEVDKGEVVCLVGPSGCGKTTTLRIAAGLEEVQSGRVTVNDRLVGDDGRHVPPEMRGVGLVFQDYALFPHLRVLENVAFGMTDGPSARARRVAANKMLDRVGLAHLANAFPHTLSGGEQQRVALARALAQKPALMLMDEPFSGLDIGLRDRIRDDTLSLLKELGTATLLVTHDPEEAMRMADRIALMREGRLVQEGAPDRVYREPDGPFCCTFFSKVNSLKGIVENGSVRTQLGRLDADHLSEGTVTQVLVRPEAIRLGDLGGSESGSVIATVVESRVLGPYSLVYVRTEVGGPVFEARVTGTHPPKPDAKCRLTLDSSQTFVFPLSSG